jgi:hypothetical protein
VRAGEIAVGVDHLGLDPQAELHAEVANVIHERVQTLRPDLAVDQPVAQPGCVVAAAREPPVVEHEAFDPHGGRGIRQRAQPGERVIEVHRLPGVERDRTWAARMLRPAPPLVVEAV